MKDIALLLLAGLCAGLMFTTGYFAIEASNKEKPAPFVKVSGASSQDRVINFFKYRTKMGFTFSQYYWVYKGQETTEEEIFLSAGLLTNKQQQEFRIKAAKKGAKRYLHTCSGIDSNNKGWSLGYCVETPARINDVQG